MVQFLLQWKNHLLILNSWQNQNPAILASKGFGSAWRAMVGFEHNLDRITSSHVELNWWLMAPDMEKSPWNSVIKGYKPGKHVIYSARKSIQSLATPWQHWRVVTKCTVIRSKYAKWIAASKYCWYVKFGPVRNTCYGNIHDTIISPWSLHLYWKLALHCWEQGEDRCWSKQAAPAVSDPHPDLL